MKAKWVVSSILIGATLMSSLSWAGGHDRPSRPEIPRSEGGGSNTGNGGVGESYEMGVVPVELRQPLEWCGAVRGMLDSALMWSGYAPTLEQKRAALAQSLRNILESYQAGEMTYQPLTYSLIATTLEMNSVFPRRGTDAMLANQVAIIVMSRMIESIKVVNEDFDLKYFVPMYRDYYPGVCRRGNCQAPALPPVAYVDGISSIRQVLSDLFAAAIPDRPTRGSVMDAMGHDLWELRALEKVMGWMESTFANDVFRRQFICLQSQISGIHQYLTRYLSGVTTGPLDSMQMRYFTESTLRNTLDYLDAYDAQTSVCRDPMRHREHRNE